MVSTMSAEECKRYAGDIERYLDRYLEPSRLPFVEINERQAQTKRYRGLDVLHTDVDDYRGKFLISEHAFLNSLAEFRDSFDECTESLAVGVGSLHELICKSRYTYAIEYRLGDEKRLINIGSYDDFNETVVDALNDVQKTGLDFDALLDTPDGPHVLMSTFLRCGLHYITHRDAADFFTKYNTLPLVTIVVSDGRKLHILGVSGQRETLVKKMRANLPFYSEDFDVERLADLARYACTPEQETLYELIAAVLASCTKSASVRKALCAAFGNAIEYSKNHMAHVEQLSMFFKARKLITGDFLFHDSSKTYSQILGQSLMFHTPVPIVSGPLASGVMSYLLNYHHNVETHHKGSPLSDYCPIEREPSIVVRFIVIKTRKTVAAVLTLDGASLPTTRLWQTLSTTGNIFSTNIIRPFLTFTKS